MIKSSVWDSRITPASFKNPIKSKWFLLLILFPVGVYGFYRVYETTLLSFVMGLLNEPDKSAGFFRDFLELVFIEIFWLTGFVLLAWIFVVYVPLLKVVQQVATGSRPVHVSAIVLLSFAGIVMVSHYTLDQFPNSSDEYAYLYQAETMGSGKLWDKAHPLADFFHFNHIAQKDGVRVGRFPPGWPLVLSVAFFLNFPPFLVNPILGLITLLVFYRFATKVYGHEVAFWSLITLAFSSFFIFNAASYFSHTACALFTVGFVYCVYLFLENSKIRYALLAGFLLGMVAITRYYTAVLIFVPVFAFVIYKLKLRSVPLVFWIGIGSLPCIGFLLWYNYSITGDPLLPVTMWAYQNEALGFVRGHTVVKGFEHIIRWMAMFFYWSSPALLVFYFFFLFKKIGDKKERWLSPGDYFFIMLMIGYFFYYQIGGNQYGPRFLFEAFPFVVVFIVNKVFQFRQKWALALFFAGLVYAVVKFPFIASREHQVITERNDLYKKVKENNISKAVIFVGSYTSVIRPMPLGDLTRNDATYKGDVLYALDMKEKNEILMRYYPNRTFYRYIRNPEMVEGRLVKVGGLPRTNGEVRSTNE